MRLLMKFLIGAGAGILLLITILYLDIYLGYQADLKACPMLNTQQIVPAVVEDITRRQRTLFGPFKIPAADIKLNVKYIPYQRRHARSSFNAHVNHYERHRFIVFIDVVVGGHYDMLNPSNRNAGALAGQSRH